MKKKFNKLKLLCFLLVLPLVPVKAQELVGFNADNYAGISGVHLQPASIADSRYLVDINLITNNFFMTNNYVNFDSKLIGFGVFNLDIQNGEDFRDEYTSDDPDPGFRKDAFINNHLQLPSFMLTITPKDAIGVSARMRAMVNIDRFENHLARNIYTEVSDESLWREPAQTPISDRTNIHQNNNASMQANIWMEWGVTYARVLMDQGSKFLKAGATVKLLQGLGSGYMHIEDLEYSVRKDDGTGKFVLYDNNGAGTFVNYGHSSNFEKDIISTLNLGEFRSNATIGLDFGLVYEWRPNYQNYKYDMNGKTDLSRRDKNKYKLKIGLSVLDIGRMRYQKTRGDINGQEVILGDFIASTGDYPNELPFFIFDSDRLEEFDESLLDYFNFVDTDGAYTMSLPTSISLQLDYAIVDEKFYVNLTPLFALKTGTADVSKNHYLTTVTLAPRFESKWFGASLPLTFDGVSMFNVGLALRLGPVIIGSRNVVPFFGASEFKRFDLFAGLKVPIPYGAPKDRDGDGVSDDMDECPDVPGEWRFMGCPDTDGDGIPDHEDECPRTPGLPEFNGCPDRDGDGIIDKLDDCPDDPGPAEYNGCPDRDGDGVIDKIDLCPDLPGPKERHGCPDRDGDGINDDVDQCPDIPGTPENNGCPYSDIDGDGIKDEVDDCPEVPGPPENNGCPYSDIDGDGVIDLEDQCPQTPGPIENRGCPIIEKEDSLIITDAFDNLEFEFDKAVIRTSSYPSLRELAAIFTSDKYPNAKLRLSGHTDSKGNDDYNMRLSERRAKAVRDFLVREGVSYDNIVVEWFGETQPIDTNETDAGRQRNRRVEMLIFFD